MSRVQRTVTLELQLDDDQHWDVATGNGPQRMEVFYLKWDPVSIYVTVSGYLVKSRDGESIRHGIEWRKTVEIKEIPSAVKAQLLAACHPADLAKS